MRLRTRLPGSLGTNLWSIVALAVFRREVNCNFDHLQTFANHCAPLRQMLGYSSQDSDLNWYSWQYLVDNIALLSPELLEKLN